MRVGFEGWQRSHGMKLMLDRAISDLPIVDSWDRLGPRDVAIKKNRNGEGDVSGITINFHTEVRLGGGQMAEITLTRKELVRLLGACADDLPLSKFSKWLSEA